MAELCAMDQRETPAINAKVRPNYPTRIRQGTKLMTDGWREGAQKALTLRDEILSNVATLPKVRRNRRRQVWSHKGANLHVNRAMRGQWGQAWRGTRKESVVGGSKCVTLNIGWGGTAGRSADELFWGGAMMLVLSEILTTAGYNVRINAVRKGQHSAAGGHYQCQRVVVKNHGEPMRPDMVAAVMCSADTYRSFGFLMICQSSFKTYSSFGRSVPWSTIAPAMAEVPEWFDANEVLVGDAWSRSQAIREITRVLTRFA